MLVADVMHRDVITVTRKTTLGEAMRLTRARGIRHLPVVEDGKLVGIVSEAARIMVMAKASALPVTETGHLIGIVTETDVPGLLVRALGAGEDAG